MLIVIGGEMFYCSPWPIIQSSQWLHLRLSSIRRVCCCHFSTTPPGHHSFKAEVTVDSRLQVKMNSLDGTRNNSDEQEEPRDHQDLSKLLVFTWAWLMVYFAATTFLSFSCYIMSDDYGWTIIGLNVFLLSVSYLFSSGYFSSCFDPFDK